MGDGDTKRQRRGWLAPRDGGYTFKSRRFKTGRYVSPTPPSGSAGVGNFNRRTDGERRSEA